MFGAKRTRNQGPSLYATRADFCRIFEKDMNRLYRLSFLLTGNEAMAEQCFVSGLHTAQSQNLVFKEWAESWARRTIILNGIRMVRPRLSSEGTTAAGFRDADDAVTGPPEVAGILELPAFERFVFIMSVLEGYGDHECSLHLNCAVGDVRAARTRALEQMARATERHQKVVSIASRGQAAVEKSAGDLRLEALPSLSASA